jgi:hypothetical protein
MTKRLVLALLLSCSPLWATTYYVDNCVTVGSDSNKGTSTSTPWLTIKKVNTSKFNPGDSILFESTCTWYEELGVAWSGSAGSPITIGSYGTGALPIFDESQVISSWTAVGSSYPNVWSATVAATPTAVFNNKVFAVKAASEAALTEGQWFASGTTLYYYESAGNPASQGYTITAAVRNYGITTGNKSYLTIQNIQVQKANSFGILVGQGSSYVTLNGVSSYYSAISGVYLRGPTSGPNQTNITVTNSDLAYNGNDGIQLCDYDSGVEISHNRIHNNSQVTATDYTGGLYSCNMVSNVTLEYNEVYDNMTTNTLSGAGLWSDCTGTGFIFRYNLIYGNSGIGIFNEITSGSQIYGNVVYGNGIGGIAIHAHTATPASNNLVYNNTVYGNKLYGIQVMSTDGSSGAVVDANFVENNIVVGNAGPQLYTGEGGENDGTFGRGNVYLYNDFGTAAKDFIEWPYGVFPPTYAAWETAAGNCGTVGCTHSVETSPTFANASAGQFWLTSGSPGIGAGLNLGTPYKNGLLPGSAWPTLVTTGPTNTPPDIGAFVYVPPVAANPPSNLHVSVH